ncbi:MAG: hypothetical protein SPK50_03075 [Mobiluncus porci]|uniref:Uncharacterized protein n=1 Tax=Mobiluncus porci TaxID=2652278 RepID=A0A7K0K1H8_9ACTO|nr:hypothetical protein [Mobiluncus porci]MDD7541211.1 hypothetical protein [Mobiluncus porci]MDY5748100.1 hypothetical protein [Mobiluncus porci]MST48900.1 hypothetical protein [Mobiluncus porci]
MRQIAATVKELIELLSQYPGDWPVMGTAHNNPDGNALHGVFVTEGNARQVETDLWYFHPRTATPDSACTIPAILLHP